MSDALATAIETGCALGAAIGEVPTDHWPFGWRGGISGRADTGL